MALRISPILQNCTSQVGNSNVQHFRKHVWPETTIAREGVMKRWDVRLNANVLQDPGDHWFGSTRLPITFTQCNLSSKSFFVLAWFPSGSLLLEVYGFPILTSVMKEGSTRVHHLLAGDCLVVLWRDDQMSLREFNMIAVFCNSCVMMFYVAECHCLQTQRGTIVE